MYFFSLLFNVYSQQINLPLVAGSSGASFTQASSEFNIFSTTYDALTWTASTITAHYGYNISWSQPMLMWNGERPDWPKWTAFAVIAYAQAYRFETNESRKSYYATKAKGGAEFLLWLEWATGQNGGIPDGLTSGSNPPATGKGPFTTGIAGVAFVECYLSFGDQKYFNAAKRTAEWQLLNPSYPYQYPAEAFMYYSNVNQHARPLWNLAEVYKITGDQRYLNRAIQLAEEIIAWQDQNQVGNCWPSGSIPDGSWWWENRDPNPIPSGVDSSPNPGATLAAERKIDYHCLTLDGLVALLESTQQQVLPGTTTIRNNVSFASFKSNLISSIKKAINYIIDNQEITNNSSLNQYRGLIQSYKLHSHAVWNTLYSGYNNSAPHGLFSIINSYLSLLKTNTLSTDDSNRLESLINSVSETLIGKYSFNWG